MNSLLLMNLMLTHKKVQLKFMIIFYSLKYSFVFKKLIFHFFLFEGDTKRIFNLSEDKSKNDPNSPSMTTKLRRLGTKLYDYSAKTPNLIKIYHILEKLILNINNLIKYVQNEKQISTTIENLLLNIKTPSRNNIRNLILDDKKK